MHKFQWQMHKPFVDMNRKLYIYIYIYIHTYITCNAHAKRLVSFNTTANYASVTSKDSKLLTIHEMISEK